MMKDSVPPLIFHSQVMEGAWCSSLCITGKSSMPSVIPEEVGSAIFEECMSYKAKQLAVHKKRVFYLLTFHSLGGGQLS
jgi:hypothetical protein